ncbi:MAG TPA: hypothetical protein VIG42_07460 [Solirubrobacteraceae bacterium]|jgi:hypothetical protein
MASGGKKKTTMAKLMRETRLRERRMDKQARRQARKSAPSEDWLGEALDPATGEPAAPEAEGAPEAQAPREVPAAP